MIIKSEKIFRGEYLLMLAVLYVISFVVIGYFSDKVYIGKFYLDVGSSPIGMISVEIGQPSIRKINAHILTIESVSIPKKYKNQSATTLLYITGETKEEVLETSKKVLKLVDTYKNEYYKDSSKIRDAIRKEFEIIIQTYKEFLEVTEFAIEEIEQLLGSDTFASFELLKQMEQKSFIEKCTHCKLDKSLQNNSLCNVCRIYSDLQKAKGATTSAEVAKKRILRKVRLLESDLVFESAKYIRSPEIKAQISNQKLQHSLALLLSISSVVLIMIVRFLIARRADLA